MRFHSYFAALPKKRSLKKQMNKFDTFRFSSNTEFFCNGRKSESFFLSFSFSLRLLALSRNLLPETFICFRSFQYFVIWIRRKSYIAGNSRPSAAMGTKINIDKIRKTSNIGNQFQFGCVVTRKKTNNQLQIFQNFQMSVLYVYRWLLNHCHIFCLFVWVWSA